MVNTQKTNIVMGAFDSENYWRDENSAKLPAISDRENNNIVLAMDELLFPFCSPDDILITRFKMNQVHVEYLRGIGFQLNCNKKDVDLSYLNGKISNQSCIFQLLSEGQEKDYFKSIIPKGAELSTFAMITSASDFCREYNIILNSPDMEVIKKVNSKIYSNELNIEWNEKNSGTLAESYEELLEVGKKLLASSPFLIKDIYGVSGKGNMLIDSEGIFERIASFIHDQEKRGKNVRFILEPFLDKEMDFSCQFYIDANGRYNFISVQKLVNSNFAYLGSFTAEQEFLDMLDRMGYFKKMELLAHKLYISGYYGHVCIDSMLLKSGEVVPVVEINARKSMSLIKNSIDRFLAQYSVQGSLTHISVSFSSEVSFADILQRMHDEGILYKPGDKTGVFPLSANTLFINREINLNAGNSLKPNKGRLYISLIDNSNEGRDILLNKTKDMLSELSFKIH